MNLILIASLIASVVIALAFIYTYSGALYKKWKLHVDNKAPHMLFAKKRTIIRNSQPSIYKP